MLSAEGAKPQSNNRRKSDLGHVGPVAYLEIGKGVCYNLRRGADTPGAPVVMIDIRATCDTIVYLI